HPGGNRLRVPPTGRSRRKGIASRPAFGNQMRVLKKEARQYLSLAADEHHALVGKFFVVDFQFLRRWWTHSAVIPDQVHRRPCSLRRIFESDGAGRRERKVILHCERDAVL